MISKRAIHATSMRSSPMYEHVLTPNRGIDETRPHSDSNHVFLTKNLDVNPDGSLSIRKPLVYMDSWDVNLKYGSEDDIVDVALKCKKVIPMYLHDTKLIVFERENYTLGDTLPKFWITILNTGDLASKAYNISIKYSDVNYKEYAINETNLKYKISTDTCTYYGIPVSNDRHFIDFSNVRYFNTSTTTVLGNCTVDLTSNLFGEADMYYTECYLEIDAAKAYRYIHLEQDTSDSDVFTVAIKTPEVNEIDPNSDIPLNPNLTLDSYYSVRDGYNKSYTEISGLQAYASNSNYTTATTRSESALSTVSYVGFKGLKFNTYTSSSMSANSLGGETCINFPTRNSLRSSGTIKCHVVNLNLELPYKAYASLYDPDTDEYRMITLAGGRLKFTTSDNFKQGTHNGTVSAVTLCKNGRIDIKFSVSGSLSGNDSDTFDGVYVNETIFKNDANVRAHTLAIYAADGLNLNDFLLRKDTQLIVKSYNAPNSSVRFSPNVVNSNGLVCASRVLSCGVSLSEYTGAPVYKLCNIITVMEDPQLSYSTILETDVFGNKFFAYDAKYSTVSPTSAIYTVRQQHSFTIAKSNMYSTYINSTRMLSKDFTSEDSAPTTLDGTALTFGEGGNTVAYDNYAALFKSTKLSEKSLEITVNGTSITVCTEKITANVVTHGSEGHVVQLNISLKLAANENLKVLKVQIQGSGNTKTYLADALYKDYVTVCTEQLLYNSNPVSIPLTYIFQSEYTTALFKVYEVTENLMPSSFKLLDTLSTSAIPATCIIKAFLNTSKVDTVYTTWEYSPNGVVWKDVYADNAYLTKVKFKDWQVDSSLPNLDGGDTASTDIKYELRNACKLSVDSQFDYVYPEFKDTQGGTTRSAYPRGDFLVFPSSTHVSDLQTSEGELPLYPNYQYRLTLFSVKNDEALEGDANALYVKQIYSQKVFTFVTGSSTNFAKTLLTNAVKGDKLYYNNRIYSYGESGFQNNILISDAGSYITPLFNVADVKTSENVTVNGLIPWRDYLIATTTSSIHLISQADAGAYVKTVSSNTGVSDKDRRTCANTYNGIIFKSGSKIFALNPNAASSDDTIMNIVELSKPISNLLESIEYDSDSFAIGTSDEYILFMPDTATNRTHCLRFSYDTKSWTYYVYDKVVLSDYYRYENNTIRLFGTHDSTYTEYVFDSDVTDAHPNLATSIEGVVPYGDYLNAESLNVLDAKGNPKEITPTAIEFALDSGQKSDSIGVIKMYLETKLILAANTTDDKFSDFTVSVYVDGNNYPIREFKDAPLLNIAPNTTFVLGGPLNDSDADMSNVIRQAYFRHAGKGNSIRYIISGKSSYNFKLYGIHVRYRILPNKT